MNKDNFIPSERYEDTPFGRFDLNTRKISKRKPNNNNGREGSIEKYTSGPFKADIKKPQPYKTPNLKQENISRKQIVRLTESRLREMIKESVRQILKESEEEFMFGDSEPNGDAYGTMMQDIIFRGEKIGVLLTCPRGFWNPPEEYYSIPDITKNDEPIYFKDYNKALDYAKKYFEQLVERCR